MRLENVSRPSIAALSGTECLAAGCDFQALAFADFNVILDGS